MEVEHSGLKSLEIHSLMTRPPSSSCPSSQLNFPHKTEPSTAMFSIVSCLFTLIIELPDLSVQIGTTIVQKCQREENFELKNTSGNADVVDLF